MSFLLLSITCSSCSLFFFFNDTATTEIYTLSLHDALPIFDERPLCEEEEDDHRRHHEQRRRHRQVPLHLVQRAERSEEHTSELQSPCNLVCRLLLEKKKKQTPRNRTNSVSATSSKACCNRD